MQCWFEEPLIGARFLWRLPAFLRNPVGLEEARETLRRRLTRREPDFLALVKRAIYEYAGSPYRVLLRLAGCEFGDLEKLVTQEGVEGALRTLFRQGVYLTVDEFKGRRPVVRGSATIAVDPRRMRNPDSAYHVFAHSGGSRGASTPVLFDLAFLRDLAVNKLLDLHARGGITWPVAVWGAPGASLYYLLTYQQCGSSCPRWFWQVDPSTQELNPRYRRSARAMHLGAWVSGTSLPRPQHVPLDAPLPIVHWFAEALQAGDSPLLLTYASSAVRLCRAALEAKVELRGVHLMVYGEPITEARLAVIRQSGAEAIPVYAAAETDRIGTGCLAPDAPDAVHLFHDLHVLIQPGAGGGRSPLPPHGLLLSTLRATAPLILLNVSLGDQAVVVERKCGCALERIGWTTRLHTIRSFEKLTAGGMTFLDTDVIRVLEEVLPARFGGAPTDYQLVEEESEGGLSRLRLLVHPAVGPLDAQAVAESFLIAISPGDGAERVMGLVWQDAKLIQVERRAPMVTTSGKILHLHLDRFPPPSPA